ncbi:MAG TPA: 16S rRNA (adenine(1518)-N(6)/adenine(1519)-N(6))-dimethyltransferase RsmA [Xanthomonadaceae bacterium]|nr:16S rRNA (adenine(1518)-N(6)/adenine(1519)-N(6))-dimethyltransferase RsmA [Xanthomonadaceae bacterium]
MSGERHAPKKRFGQHFLHDPGTLRRIVQALAPRHGQRIVEIGPGQGALTLPLLDACGELTAIELDRDLIEPLEARAASHGILHVIQADVLEVDLTALAAGGLLRLVGNLPYNVSSPILFHCMAHLDAISDMHFMLQKEVVERMAATPGGKVYGRLSVMLQARCRVDPLFEVAPACFRPPPKVESAVVRLRPRPAGEVDIVDAELFGRLVKAGFAQRRKTLSNALSALADAATIEAAGIDPRARAETVAVEGWCRLTHEVASPAT